MGRCPPGVLCVENITLFTVLIIAFGVILFIQMHYKNNNLYDDRPSVQPATRNVVMRPNTVFTDAPNDVMMSLYEPPLRDNSIFNNSARRVGGDIRRMPINVPTQSVESDYRQVGILTRINGQETILPLLGRPLFSNRDKWNFYTMSDKNNMIKLPITHKGKSCTNEYGCDNIYNGDTVYVEGYNDAFKATMYDNQIMRYIPYL